ncbi:MAG: antibiotic biosynthesis monooxygenase [marine bacterium B5-7]|nr:MAG: antibiotic biosynthesis monooxygenase [marine bacterium B5-7]
MSAIANTPRPPYYAVIFTSVLSNDTTAYNETAERMMVLAAQQAGFLGVETARGEIGMTVSYWRDLESIKAWREQAEHREARRLGRERWYSAYCLRIARVERDYQGP